MAHVPEELYYSLEHVWLRVQDGDACLGLTDYAQKHLGVILFADGEPEGSELSSGDVAGVAEGVKGAVDVLTPVAGVIIAFNRTLTDAPERINDAPYDCWLVKLALREIGELDGLMRAGEYADYCAGL